MNNCSSISKTMSSLDYFTPNLWKELSSNNRIKNSYGGFFTIISGFIYTAVIALSSFNYIVNINSINFFETSPRSINFYKPFYLSSMKELNIKAYTALNKCNNYNYCKTEIGLNLTHQEGKINYIKNGEIIKNMTSIIEIGISKVNSSNISFIVIEISSDESEGDFPIDILSLQTTFNENNFIEGYINNTPSFHNLDSLEQNNSALLLLQTKNNLIFDSSMFFSSKKIVKDISHSIGDMTYNMYDFLMLNKTNSSVNKRTLFIQAKSARRILVFKTLKVQNLITEISCEILLINAVFKALFSVFSTKINIEYLYSSILFDTSKKESKDIQQNSNFNQRIKFINDNNKDFYDENSKNFVKKENKNIELKDNFIQPSSEFSEVSSDSNKEENISSNYVENFTFNKSSPSQSKQRKNIREHKFQIKNNILQARPQIVESENEVEEENDNDFVIEPSKFRGFQDTYEDKHRTLNSQNLKSSSNYILNENKSSSNIAQILSNNDTYIHKNNLIKTNSEPSELKLGICEFFSCFKSANSKLYAKACNYFKHKASFETYCNSIIKLEYILSKLSPISYEAQKEVVKMFNNDVE